MRKLICILLASLFILSAAGVAVFAEETYSVDAYGTDGEGQPTNIPLDTSYAVRLGMNAPFRAVSVRLSTYTKADTVATLMLYKWDATYDKTVKNDPVAEIRIDPVRDNLKHQLEFDEQPAGEYLIRIRNDNSQLCVWKWDNNDVSKGLLYVDGVETVGEINVTVFFTGKTDEPFSEVKPSVTSEGSGKAPVEYVPDENSNVVARAAHPTTWTATDELGRTLPTYEDVGGLKEDKVVALFYWSWHVSQDSGEPVNVQKIMDEHPEAKNDYYSSVWPTTRSVFFWNESVYGYYKTNDRWVLRKHAELLADAGVDVLFFDNTNGTLTFKDSYQYIYEVFEQALEDGVNAPKISFILPFGDDKSANIQIRSLYSDIFQRQRYQKLWFYYDGKPMIMCNKGFVDSSDALGKQIKKFFTFRAPQAGYKVSGTAKDSWGWLSTYPQALYYAKGDNENVEQVTVGVAVNHNYKTGRITAMNGENVIGRTYTSQGVDTRENAVKYGANFSEQFEYALSVDPKVIFITGWNEWIAGRYKVWPEDPSNTSPVDNAFPDEFNDEFSRDIEPSKGNLRDNYYYQMVSYIRKFKGCEPTKTYREISGMNINDLSLWEGVEAEYIAYANNISNRDAKGYGSMYYTDNSGRNDIVSAKVASDAYNVYFYVECADDITDSSDKNWMNLYIDSTDDKGWETFDYIIGKKPYGEKAYLQKLTENYGTTDETEVDYYLEGKCLVVSVPKKAICIDGTEYKIAFKWTDNVMDEDGSGEFKGEILDFYRTGDVAPGGRFKYVYASVSDGSASPVTNADTDTGENAQTTSGKDVKADNNKNPVFIYILAGVTAVIAAGAVVMIIVRKKQK